MTTFIITDLTKTKDLGQWQHEMLTVLDNLTAQFNKEAHVNKTFHIFEHSKFNNFILGIKSFASNQL